MRAYQVFTKGFAITVLTCILVIIHSLTGKAVVNGQSMSLAISASPNKIIAFTYLLWLSPFLRWIFLHVVGPIALVHTRVLLISGATDCKLQGLYGEMLLSRPYLTGVVPPQSCISTTPAVAQLFSIRIPCKMGEEAMRLSRAVGQQRLG